MLKHSESNFLEQCMRAVVLALQKAFPTVEYIKDIKVTDLSFLDISSW